MHPETDRQGLVNIQTIGGSQCGVCGRPIGRRQLRRQGTCERSDCREKHAAHTRATRERQCCLERQQRIRLGALRDQVAGAIGVARPEAFAPTALPACQMRLSVLPPSRRRAFRQRLVRLIRKALNHALPPAEWARPSEESPGPDPFLPLATAACGLCRGYCCRRGGDHAFLDVETVRRYMSEHPTEQPMDVFDAYLSKLDDHTFEGSCVFHGENGCVLPVAMRPDICTSFECQGLGKLRQIGEPPPLRTFLAALDGDEPVRFAFVSSPSDGTSLSLNLGRLHGRRI